MLVAVQAAPLAVRQDSGGAQLSTPVIIGLAVGGVVLLIVIGAIIHCMCNKKDKARSQRFIDAQYNH
ncbi:hypothetical protein H4R19_000575 [Coemansia spiralis]|nr:hypothetical protein H4R19_000575 [Coemansia spiralis]